MDRRRIVKIRMKDEDSTIDRLRIALFERFGEPITSRDQVNRFKAMFDAQRDGHSLSDSTLRRFFGLVRTTTRPTRSTLDALACFLGYESFYRFGIGASPTPDLDCVARNVLQAVFNPHHRFGSRKVLSELQYMPYRERVLTTQTLILLAVQNKNYAFLEVLFNTPELFDEKHYLEADSYVLIHVLGRVMRDVPVEQAVKIWNAWAAQPSSANYFHGFVDMDTLLVRHHKAIVEYARHKTSLQSRLFSNSLLFWKAFWADDSLEKQKHLAEAIETDLKHDALQAVHQIPRARAMNALMVWYMATENVPAFKTLMEQTEDALSQFQHNRKPGEEPFFEYWICEGLVLTKQKRLLGKCLRTVKRAEKDLTLNYYNEGALARITVYAAIHAVWTSSKRKLVKDDIADRFFNYSREYDTLFLFYYRWLVNGGRLSTEATATLEQLLTRTRWRKMWEGLMEIRLN